MKLVADPSLLALNAWRGSCLSEMIGRVASLCACLEVIILKWDAHSIEWDKILCNMRLKEKWCWRAMPKDEANLRELFSTVRTETENWSVVGRTRDVLGEGPIYLPKDDAVYWVDVSSGLLKRHGLRDCSFDHWDMGEPIGFALPQAPGGLILGLASGLYLFDPAFPSTQPRLLWHNTESDHRLNDGAFDGYGRLWFGVMHRNGEQPSGRLMCFDNGEARSVDSGYFVPNGPAFSADGGTLFHTDSPRGEIYAFTVGKSGDLSDRRIHLKFTPEAGAPDGMTIDEQGYLWVAHWGGGCVSRFDPDGKLDRRINLPVSLVTNCVFAGAKLDRMFVTTASTGCSGDELAGALFEIDPDVRGLAPQVISN